MASALTRIGSLSAVAGVAACIAVACPDRAAAAPATRVEFRVLVRAPAKAPPSGAAVAAPLRRQLDALVARRGPERPIHRLNGKIRAAERDALVAWRLRARAHNRHAATTVRRWVEAHGGTVHGTATGMLAVWIAPADAGRLRRLPSVLSSVPADRAPRHVPDRTYLSDGGQYVELTGAGELHRASIDGRLNAGPVAIFDSGIDLSHPAFAGVPSPKLIRNGNDCSTLSNYNDYHGTTVASVALSADAAHPAMLTGTDGARPRLLALTARCGVDVGLQWALAEAPYLARITNHSYGTSPAAADDRTATDSVDDRIFDSWSAATGALIVAAVGNGGREYVPASPAQDGSTIAVGARAFDDATGSDIDGDKLSRGSNWGPTYVVPGTGGFPRRKPDLVAFGDLVQVASPGGQWTRASGTSFSSPMVAGAASLLMDAGVLEGQRVKALLLLAADRPADRDRWDPGWGWGSLNAKRAYDLRGLSSMEQVPQNGACYRLLTPSGGAQVMAAWYRHVPVLVDPPDVADGGYRYRRDGNPLYPSGALDTANIDLAAFAPTDPTRPVASQDGVFYAVDDRHQPTGLPVASSPTDTVERLKIGGDQDVVVTVAPQSALPVSTPTTTVKGVTRRRLPVGLAATTSLGTPVPCPDLSATMQANAPAEPLPGDTFMVSQTVTNIAPAPTALALASTVQTLAVTGPATVLGPSTVGGGALDPSGTRTATWTVRVDGPGTIGYATSASGTGYNLHPQTSTGEQRLTAFAPRPTLAYAPTPRAAVVGQPFGADLGGLPAGATCAVAPTLPAGLALDAATGRIAGTPTAATPETTYATSCRLADGRTVAALPLRLSVAARFVVKPPEPARRRWTVRPRLQLKVLARRTRAGRAERRLRISWNKTPIRLRMTVAATTPARGKAKRRTIVLVTRTAKARPVKAGRVVRWLRTGTQLRLTWTSTSRNRGAIAAKILRVR